MTEKKAPELPWELIDGQRVKEVNPKTRVVTIEKVKDMWAVIPEAEARELLDMRAERDRLREALKYRTSACLAFDRMLQWDWFQQALLDAPRDIIEQIEFAREQSNIADQALARIAEIVGK